MLGTIILPLILVIASPEALPLERVSSAYCETSGNVALPCVPAACSATFCETGFVRMDGALVCVDSDEVYPAGHWMVDDFQEDGKPGDSIHYVVEY